MSEPKLVTNDFKDLMRKGEKRFDIYIEYSEKLEDSIFTIMNKFNGLTIECYNKEELKTLFQFIMQKKWD